MTKRQIAIAKDKILEHLSGEGTSGLMSEKIADNLKMPHHIVYSLLKEIERRDHVNNISTASANTSFEVCHSRITNAGSFFKDTLGYEREFKREQRINFPKNYWYVMLLLGFLLGFFSDVLKQKLLGKSKERIYYIQPSKNQDTIILMSK